MHLSRATQEIVIGEEYAYRMNFNDGADGRCEYLETDLIVFSAGIRPQDALGRSAELESPARRHRDRWRHRTSDPDLRHR